MRKHRDIERAEQFMDPYLEDLKTIVNIDSGTFTKAGVDRVGAYLQERFQALGFSTHFDRQEQVWRSPRRRAYWHDTAWSSHTADWAYRHGTARR